MVQNLFNHLELIDLARAKEYGAFCLDWTPAANASLGRNVVSVLLRFVSPNQEVAFDVHGYFTPEVTLLGSGMLDPKSIVFNRAVHIAATHVTTPVPVEPL
ncbi:MAG: hypothetical protein KF883_10710 [Thermomicrobiales bacterium]|nr:hypothetical protein [Thermomicrobiales bacterium]